MSADHSSPPPTSATVLEFICLFTHDLKRKQKRWQDGRLKYHTFNNRIMVYDDRGNFVGDMHWRHDWELTEGEEVQLERGGVIVQVQELSSRSEQDLSELLDKRAKEKEKRQAQAVARTLAPSVLPRTAVRPVVTRPIQQHRPLHHVIGTPSGHHGRALVPKESPFEQRQQTADSPDDRAVKRRRQNEPPPSKSGYASALFGQTLTLSATPMSSLPVVNPRTVRDRDPSPETEAVTMRPARQEPEPPLREQPKASRHFNQPMERLGQFETAKDIVSKAGNMDEDDEPPLRRKQDRNLLKKKQIERKRQPTPDDDDDEVIEIDDPGPAVTEVTECSARSERAASKPSKDRKKTTAKPNAPLSRKKTTASTSKSGRVEDSPDEELEERQNMSKKQERMAKLKKLKTKPPKPVVKKTTSKASVPKNIEEPVEKFARNPSDPVTELRLKSRKKRGLLMIADMSNEPRAQPRGDSNGPLVGNSNVPEIEETDFSFRSLSPQPCGKAVKEKSSSKANTPDQGTKPGAIEVDDESFWFASPEPRATKYTAKDRRGTTSPRHNDFIESGAEDNFFPSPTLRPRTKSPKSTSRDNSVVRRSNSEELGEDIDITHAKCPVPTHSDVAAADDTVERQGQDVDFLGPIPEDDLGSVTVDAEDENSRPVDDLTSDMINKPAMQKKICDPYRMPSSSPEEDLEPSARRASNLVDRRDIVALSGGSDKTQTSVHRKKATTAQRPRALRNVILDEDDELDTPPESAKQAEPGTVDVFDLDSDDDLPLKPQRKAKKVIKRKAKVLEDSGEDEVGSDLGDVPSKKQVKPKKPKKPAKRKSPLQEDEPDFDLEDEQPIKRRNSARKTRGRATEPKETPLSSEQEASEAEPNPKRSRKKKPPKASVFRPRLEKLKKSVKSRELIGFDLSALNAPLGLRGIGMPFSILSSPVNESIQRRIDSHAAVEPSSDSVLDELDERVQVATSDAMQTILEADEMGLNALSSPEMGRAQILTGPRMPSFETHTNMSRERDGAVPIAEMALPDNTFAPLMPPEPQRKSKSPAPQVTAEPVRMPRPAESQASPAVEAPKIEIFTERTSNGGSDLLQNAPAMSGGADAQTDPSEDASPMDAASTSPSNGVVAKPFVPPSKAPISAAQHQQKISRSIDDVREVPDEAELELLDELQPNQAPALPAFKKPEQKTNSALQRQESSTIDVTVVDEAPNDVDLRDITEVTPAIVPALPAFKRPEQIPIAQREPAHAVVADVVMKLAEEVEPGETSEAASVAVSNLPAFKRPEPKVAPALRRQSSRNVNSKMDEPKHDMDHDQTIDEAVVEDAQESVEETVQQLTRVIRKQPPSFKPPTKTRTNSAKSDIENPTGVDMVKGSEVFPESNQQGPGPAAPMQRQKSRTFQRTVSATRRINNITAEPKPAPNEDSAESSTKAAANARITNPASRGRKAAVKADAKGPVPQRLLPPTQPFALGPMSTADLTMTPIEEPQKEPERKKKKMTFPGFQSARDEGPWSREAFDLMESGRPG